MSTPRAPLSAALAVALVASVAGGCDSQTTRANPAAAAEGGPCSRLAQGVSPTTIKVGTTLPLTGGASVAGQGFKAGLRAAVASVNERGGINGRQLGLTVLDDGFEAARSVANVRRLGEEDRVFAVLGPAGSANLPGSFRYLAAKGLPMFAPVLPPDPRQREVWMVATSHADQVRVIIDWLASEGVRSVALVSQDNDLGAAFAAGIAAQAPKHGIALVASENLEPNSTDISSAVLNVKAKNPQAVISGTDNSQTALLLKQAKELGWSPIIVGNSSSGGPGSPNTVGPAGSAAEGFYASAIMEFPSSPTPAVQQYRSAMDKLDPGQTDNSFALQAYASAQVFFHLLDQLGDDLCWQQFQAKAEALSGLDTGLIPPVSFGRLPAGHRGTKGARITRYTDSRWVTVTDFIEPKP